jgi:hypothetical protein
MRRIALALLTLLSVTAAYARTPVNYDSGAVYTSSFTCANSQLHSVWISSPNAADLYQIKISSIGIGGAATVSVYDGVGSTSTAKLVDSFSPLVYKDHFYEVGLSSWLGVHSHSQDGVPPCLTIIYRRR